MNLCLMGRQCLHRQHGCSFSQEGIDDATQNSSVCSSTFCTYLLRPKIEKDGGKDRRRHGEKRIITTSDF